MTGYVNFPAYSRFTDPSSVSRRRQWQPTPVLFLENPMDRGAWWAAVHGVTKSRAQLNDFTFTHWRRKWKPTPVFLPGESQGQKSLVAAVSGVAQSWTWLKWLSSSSISSSVSMNSYTYLAAAAAASLQSCLSLCDPIDGSLPGSPIPGILQARTLEWVAISFSNAWKWSHSVVSDPQRPHGLQPSRLLRPWDFPGKSTGVGCHCSQLIFDKKRQEYTMEKRPSLQ